jgi:hypothetical protein
MTVAVLKALAYGPRPGLEVYGVGVTFVIGSRGGNS